MAKHFTTAVFIAVFLIFFGMVQAAAEKASARQPVLGADISYLDQLETCGARFYEDGVEKPLLSIFKDNGVSWIRLRLWVNPETGGNGDWCNLERTVAMAKRVKACGFKFLLDFHYSDTWADPAHQTIPEAWKDFSYEQIKVAVGEYTSSVLKEFIEQNCPPDMVQVGNEITNGMLFPYGSAANGNVKCLMELLKTGCSAVRRTLPQAKIMIHLDKGSNNSFCTWWFGEAEKAGVDYDAIGLSYYPFWQSTDLSVLAENISGLKKTFAKKVFVAETAYPWTFGWSDNRTNNVGEGIALVKDCAATPEGQKMYLEKLLAAVKKAGGAGVFWWAPEAVAIPGFESDWENLTWFDFNCNFLLK